MNFYRVGNLEIDYLERYNRNKYFKNLSRISFFRVFFSILLYKFVSLRMYFFIIVVLVIYGVF